MRARSMAVLAIGVLAIAGFLGTWTSCTPARPAAEPHGVSTQPPETLPQTSDTGGPGGAGMAKDQLECSLRRTRMHVEWTDAAINRRDWLGALEQATRAAANCAVLAETCEAIAACGPKRGPEYAAIVADAKKVAEGELRRLRARCAWYVQEKRNWITGLSPKELARAFRSSEPITVPDEGTVVDILAELEVRERAASALLERVRNPHIDGVIPDTAVCTAEQGMANAQVSSAVAYELVVAEAEWLLSRAHESQRPRAQRLVDAMKRDIPAIEALHPPDMLVMKSSDWTYKKLVADKRKQCRETRMKFPEKITIRE